MARHVYSSNAKARTEESLAEARVKLCSLTILPAASFIQSGLDAFQGASKSARLEQSV